MEHNFKVGDTVECIDPSGYLIQGEQYKVSCIAKGYIGVMEGVEACWYCDRFKLAPVPCIKEAALDVQVGGGHYKDYAIQPIEFFMANKIPYAEAAIIKYAMRHASKNGKEDLEKAKHLIDILIEAQYNDGDTPSDS